MSAQFRCGSCECPEPGGLPTLSSQTSSLLLLPPVAGAAAPLVVAGLPVTVSAKAPAGLPRVPAPMRVMPAKPTMDPARRAANAPIARLGLLGSPGRRTSLLIGARILLNLQLQGIT